MGRWASGIAGSRENEEMGAGSKRKGKGHRIFGEIGQSTGHSRAEEIQTIKCGRVNRAAKARKTHSRVQCRLRGSFRHFKHKAFDLVSRNTAAGAGAAQENWRRDVQRRLSAVSVSPV